MEVWHVMRLAGLLHTHEPWPQCARAVTQQPFKQPQLQCLLHSPPGFPSLPGSCHCQPRQHDQRLTPSVVAQPELEDGTPSAAEVWRELDPARPGQKMTPHNAGLCSIPVKTVFVDCALLRARLVQALAG